jgi:anhydro-N-acetylmuramic acid kinase
MHPSLRRLLDRPERIVVGLMSGTSLDGVDAAVVRLAGSGRGLSVQTLGFATHAYDAAMRALLQANVEDATSGVREVALLHVALAHRFADTADDALARAGVDRADVDLVGSHGQTIQHVPQPTDCAGAMVRATLQIGDPATLALRLSAPVVADFRSADVALGGQGAPLVPYLDDVLFATADETRGLLNLGGIANLTVLPRGGSPADAVAFDTGPANMVIDELARRTLGVPYDDAGAGAAAGRPDDALLERLLADPFFAEPPPRSSGRERFGAAYVDMLIAEGPSAPEDLLATATALTVRSVAGAYRRFIAERHVIDRLIVSGGGTRNASLMFGLAAEFAPAPVETTAAYGLDPDAKEAVLFAVLAHEWANGVATGLPAVTGAGAPALLGSLTLG